jgi:geranylgeranyl diphosphate synthase type II
VVEVSFEEFLFRSRQLVDKALDDMLPQEDNGLIVLHQAMRYSVFAGGKRVRPILAMAAAEVVGGQVETVLPLAVSLECIHTYSLIHDDLPAMDNDDLRRGKPTAHKVFGDAVAILAGDALLTFAFEVLGSPEVVRVHRSDRLLAVIGELAAAAGSKHLIAGQVMDIVSEGKAVDAVTVDQIVKDKTAALIRVSLSCGAILAGGSTDEIQILGLFGERIGKVFQIRDDLLDLEGDPEKLGKAVRKDEQRGKATYPMLLGRDRAHELMRSLIASAMEAIQPLGKRGDVLISLAEYLGRRTS